MKTEQPNYYALLGVNTFASPEAIRQAFFALQAEYKGKGALSAPYFQQVSYAFEVLSDPDRRSLYDSLLHETSADPHLLVNGVLSRSKIGLANAPQVVYLLVDVRPSQPDGDARLPLNLCLVLDRSTSMRGARLGQVQGAVEMVLEKLGPEDTVSIVSFSDRAEVLLPPTRTQDTRRLLASVRGMVASGGTEIYQGLQAGVAQMQQVALERHVNHLILLTDGHTYGDEELCVQLARETAVQGIGFTAFGIGLEWNDQFLDRLVAPSGGQSGYIDQPIQIIEFLEKRIQGLGAIYAQDVRFQLDLPSAIYLRYGFKMTPYAQPLAIDADHVKLGDIEGRRPLSFLLELGVAPQPVESRITLPINLTATIPGRKIRQHKISQTLQLVSLADPPDEEIPEPLLKSVRMLSMYRLNEQVWHDVEAGHVEMATRRMRHLTSRFLEIGQTRLAQQAQLETERLSQMGGLSLEGRKTLKFGTRTLLNQTMTLLLNAEEEPEND